MSVSKHCQISLGGEQEDKIVPKEPLDWKVVQRATKSLSLPIGALSLREHLFSNKYLVTRENQFMYEDITNTDFMSNDVTKKLLKRNLKDMN